MHVNLVCGLSDWVREERKIHFEEKENDKVKRYSSKKCRESVCWEIQPERKAERSRMFAVVFISGYVNMPPSGQILLQCRAGKCISTHRCFLFFEAFS